ncbi:MAG: hypothetical protein V1725_07315 [archaeon]
MKTLLALALAATMMLGCEKKAEDNPVMPTPVNSPPETVLLECPPVIGHDAHVRFRVGGSDEDGTVQGFRYLLQPILPDTQFSLNGSIDFTLEDSVYHFMASAVDDEWAVDPSPVTYTFTVDADTTPPRPAVDFFHETDRWIAYAPTNFNPNIQQFPSEESILADLEVLVDANFTCVVTYGADGTLGRIPLLARNAGMQHVVMGIWSLTNTEEWNAALANTAFVDGYCLGNEGLMRNDYTLAELEARMAQLRALTGKPVTTTEPIGAYDTALLDAGDWAFPNTHPFWANITNPETAAAWTEEQYTALSGRTQQVVIMKEVGLPTEGAADLSEENQNSYYRLMEGTTARFVYFEAFDQPWKNSQPIEPHWGLFMPDRTTKLASQPQVLFTHVPPLNSYENLQGRIVNVLPQNFKTTTYINVNGTWWVKPYANTPLTSIAANGTWTTDITTGGIDQTAGIINTYLVTPDYPADLHALPSLEDTRVLTYTTASR